MIQSNKVNSVVVYKFDRSSRNITDLKMYVQKIMLILLALQSKYI